MTYPLVELLPVYSVILSPDKKWTNVSSNLGIGFPSPRIKYKGKLRGNELW